MVAPIVAWVTSGLRAGFLASFSGRVRHRRDDDANRKNDCSFQHFMRPLKDWIGFVLGSD
jgi:hypothetical protein